MKIRVKVERLYYSHFRHSFISSRGRCGDKSCLSFVDNKVKMTRKSGKKQKGAWIYRIIYCTSNIPIVSGLLIYSRYAQKNCQEQLGPEVLGPGKGSLVEDYIRPFDMQKPCTKLKVNKPC